MISLLTATAFAADLPRIAVYVTGNVSEDEKTALGTRMLASLVNSGRYMGIERSSAFMAEVEREQTTQRSGAIDDSHISELGKQFGVRFVCIAAITPAFGSYQVSARIVDVETAVVVHIGDAASPLRTMADLTQVSNDVVRAMFGAQPNNKPQAMPALPGLTEKPLFWGGAGLEALGVGLLIYGIVENGNVTSHSDKYQYSKADSSVKARNVLYGLGAAALLGGITIHILF